MAGKRSASSELNHLNWNQDDEPEESGTFQKAAEDVLKTRVIKTARRRNPITSNESGESNKAFSGFTAFSKTAPPTSSAFGFLSNLSKSNANDITKTNGISEKTEEKKEAKQATSQESSVNNTSNDQNKEFYAKLKGLNESVLKWIKTHVEENPLINLQPVFRDYEKYFKELEKDQNVNETKEKESKNESIVFFKPQNSASPSTKPTDSKIPQFSFGSAMASSTTTTPTFSFSAKPPTSLVTSQSGTFSFGSNASTASAGFSFTSTSDSAPFTFGNVAKPTEEKKDDEEEDEDEPPKVEFKPVVEEGNVFTTRCKVFVKNSDGAFGDRGVGNLFLKPIADSEKVQLIVRADTNLGNLLLNLVLSENVPLKRMGKKDVMLICLPLPDSKPPPVMTLLRVKTPEEADTLLETLQKYQK